MKKASFTTKKIVDVVCEEVEEIITGVLGVRVKKNKIEKAIVYYPAQQYAGMDDNMDDVKIIIRKVNNSITSIKLENAEVMAKHGNFRSFALQRAYEILKSVMEKKYA